MKSLFTLSRISFIGAFVCLLASFHVNAQVTGYTQAISNGTYTPVSGAGVVSMNVTGSWLYNASASTGGTSDAVNFAAWNGSLDEVNIGTTGFGFPIGFNFQYGGRTFDRFAISSTGHITLGTSKQLFAAGRFSYNSVNPGNASGPLGIYSDNSATPSTINIEFDRSLRALSHSLIPNVGATVKYQVTGTAPNRVLTVEWANFARSILTIDNINFQIKLNENGNTFAYVYGPMTLSEIANTYHNQCQVGFRGVTREFLNNFAVAAQNQRLVINGTGGVAWGVASTTAVSGSFLMDFKSTNFPASGLTYTWTPPAYTGCGPKGSVISISLAGTSANLTWSAPPFGTPTSYEIDIRANFSAGAFTAVTGSPFSGTSASITGLVAGNSYECRMRTNCGGTFSGYETFVISIPGPGDNCNNAIPYGTVASNSALCTPVNVAAGLVNDGSANLACNTNNGILTDVWYSFVAPVNGKKLVFETTPDGISNPDWAMEIYSSCSGQPIACWDDYSTTDLRPVGELVPQSYVGGQTYYLRLMQLVNLQSGPTINLCVYEENNCPSPIITPGSDLTFCSGSSVLLNTSGGISYQWNRNDAPIPGASGLVYVASISGSYTVTVTDANNCTATSSATVVTVNDSPLASITAASNTTFCFGGSVVLNANTGTGLSYVWKKDGTVIDGASSDSYAATAAGSYTVTVINAAGCSSTSPAIAVSVNPLPVPAVSASGTLNLCTGGSVTLSTPAVSGQTYAWKNNGTAITGATSNSYTASAAGSYTVTVTSAAGCQATSSASGVTMNAIPSTSTTLTGPTMICTLTSGTYTASAVTGAISYTWTLPSGLTGTSSTNSISVAINDLNFTSGAVSVKANTAFCSSAAKSLTIAKVPATPATLSGSPTVTCGIARGSYTCAASTGATQYNWTLPAGYSGTSTTSSIATSINNSTFTSGNISVTASNTCGTSAAKTLAVSKVPFTPASISGPTITCGLTAATYTAATGNNVSSYTWTLPAGMTGSSTTNVISVSIDNNVFVSGNISVIASNSCGSSAARTLAVSKAPATPTSVTGPTQLCGLTSATFTCTAMTGATSYNWVLPAGLSGTSSTNSITVAVNPSLFTSGSVSVQSVNSCGTSAAKSLALTKVLAASTTLSGPSFICGLTTATYTATAVTGATSYNWVLPAGLTGTSTTNTITVTVNPANYTSGSVSVAAVNACGIGTAKALALSKIPATPTTLSGPAAAVCAGSTQNYTCTAMANASSYTWTVPTGAVINSGQGTSSISVTFPSTFASGTVSVTANSACGSSTAKSLTVAAKTAQPGTITGTTTNLCGGGTYSYSIASVTGATSYTWTAPTGCSFSGASTGTSVSLVVPAGFTSGTLSVVANNACGASTARTLAISGAPAAPTTLTGPASVCPSAAGLVYSTAAVTGASTYTWTVPTGAIITAGSGTSSITVKWGTVTGSVTVKAGNACGTNATAKSLAVALVACRTAGEEPSEEVILTPEVLVYPNPGKDIFHLQTKDFEAGKLQVRDVLGREVLSKEINASESSVDLGSMPFGTYFFHIHADGFSKVVKVVKR